MIRRNMRMMLTALVLSASLIAAPAMAKNLCSPLKNKTKGCKNEMKGRYNLCIAVASCKTLKGKAKRTCLRDCKNAAKALTVDLCKLALPTSAVVCTASPSGAFLGEIQ